MKIQKNKIYTFLITAIAIFISIYFWKVLHIPYQQNGIVGNYSINNYNALNDPIKYLLFILLPTATFIFCKIFIENESLLNFLNFFKKENHNNDVSKINIIFYLIFILVCIEFFSVEFPLHKLDIFHSGQKLNGAYKSYFDTSLWSGSYITSGLFIEIFNGKLIWKIFSHQSIGLLRLFDLILILICKLVLLVLSFEISKTLNLQNSLKQIFFIILSLILLQFIDYDINSADLIEYREIPILIFLILVLFYIRSNSSNFRYSILLFSLLSVTTFFWSIDRAIVYNFLLFSLIIYLLINKDHQNPIIIIFFTLVFWGLSFLILKEEFSFFLSSTRSILSEINNIHGIIHPIPFSDDADSTRATKTLLTILFSVLISADLIIKNKNSNNKTIKIFLVLISLVSFFSYIYALGRSDGGHIKQAFGYPLIFFILLTLIFIFNLLDKINLRQNENYIKISVFVSIIVFSQYIFNFNLNNIKSYKSNLTEYIYFEDEKFLTKDDINFVNQASYFLSSEKCIDLYTYDSPLLYLLKKPSCSKFSFLWSLGSKKNQREYIQSLKDTKFIITDGKTDNWSIVPFKIKYPLLDKFINENFTNEFVIGSRKIKFKN